MKPELSLTNVSFDFLAKSSEFLNLILNNITCCVLLLDNQMRLIAYNDSLKTIFSNAMNEDLLYRRCGEVIGCAYQIEEEKQCGNTSHCNHCELRISALTSYTKNIPIFKDRITRAFYNYENKKINKHLQFSTRLFSFKKENYIILIIEDITRFVETEDKYNELINNLTK